MDRAADGAGDAFLQLFGQQTGPAVFQQRFRVLPFAQSDFVI